MAATREPALTVGAVVALVGAVLTLLIAFGVDLTEEQQNAILRVVAIAAPLVAAVVTRRFVTPAEKPGRHRA